VINDGVTSIDVVTEQPSPAGTPIPSRIATGTAAGLLPIVTLPSVAVASPFVDCVNE
jgi:hypothetical protein